MLKKHSILLFTLKPKKAAHMAQRQCVLTTSI